MGRKVHLTEEPFLEIRFEDVIEEKDSTIYWFILTNTSLNGIEFIDDNYGLCRNKKTGKTTVIDIFGMPVTDKAERDAVLNRLRTTDGEWLSDIIRRAAGVMFIWGGYIEFDDVCEYIKALNQPDAE